MLRNETLGTQNSLKVLNYNNFNDKTRGVMNLKENAAIFFKTRFGLHTFFIKNTLDIVILDKENRVVKIKKGLKSNKLFFWNPKYDKVLELPSGSIKDLKLNIEHILKFDL